MAKYGTPQRRRAARPRATPSRTRKGAPAATRRGARDARAGAGREFQNLVDVMHRLRGPGGCPWDRKQTLESLRQFVLEETYEVLDAIDRGDRARLGGEIGDFLFEGVFLAQILADEGASTVADALRAVTAKLIRRHPHVFGGRKGVDTAGQVLQQWEQIKAGEQQASGERTSVLAGLPPTLPALLGAHEIGTRVAAVGFDWPDTGGVVDKIEEEVAELRQAVGREGRRRIEEEMGDLLFSIAQLSRKLGVDAEAALRKANTKFAARFAALERRLESRGRSVHDASLEEMEEVWAEIKK